MKEGNLYIGWANKSITPEKPVYLQGQFFDRISEYVQSELTVTVLALQTKDDSGNIIDEMMIGSCSLIGIPANLLFDVRAKLDAAVPDFDTEKLILNATHTHTAPNVISGILTDILKEYTKEFLSPDQWLPTLSCEDAVSFDEYHDFLVDRICEACREAWESRTSGSVNFALGRAVLGHNRRISYTDGHSKMYGEPNTIEYSGPEDRKDHGVELMYFRDASGNTTGAAVNSACPSQVVEEQSFISSDYWGEMQKELEKRNLKTFHILPICGAAGDQSPRDLARRGQMEPDMHGVEGAIELGRRLTDTVIDCIDLGKPLNKIRIEHKVLFPSLPIRKVTAAEYESTRNTLREFARRKNGGAIELEEMYVLYEYAGIIKRYEQQKKELFYIPEIHVVRICDAVIVTNPFELFTLYGLRMKARSKAQQTFIIQLACDWGGYLPTHAAVSGGGYSGYAACGIVGPEGGDYLTEYTIDAINGMF